MVNGIQTATVILHVKPAVPIRDNKRIQDVYKRQGLNAGTLLPGPLAFRWTFQFYDYGSISEELAELLERISPYFLNDIQVFGVAFAEAAVFLALIAMVYRRREI